MEWLDVLRRIEAGARAARQALNEDDDERAYLSWLRRVGASAGGGADRAPDTNDRTTPGGLILPP